MNAEAQTALVLDQAAGHLHAAADRADLLAGADTFSEWHDVASQVRLTASGLSHSPVPISEQAASITDALTSALEVLDTIPVDTRPADLLLWVWHIRELHQFADAAERQ
jgi:hypothetical protein